MIPAAASAAAPSDNPAVTIVSPTPATITVALTPIAAHSWSIALSTASANFSRPSPIDQDAFATSFRYPPSCPRV